MNRTTRGWKAACGLTAAALVLATQALTGCAAEVKSNSSEVTIAVQPLLDYAPWEFARTHGLAAELGLTLNFTYLTQVNTAIQALERHEVDVVSTCTACNLPYLVSVPSVRDIMTIDQFKGFIIVGRAGAPSYDQLVAQGHPDAQARQIVYDNLKGKTLIGNKVIFGPLVKGLEQYANLQPGDINIVDMPDDAKAATAFLSGQGDFYMGSLAQESKLLQNYPDKFVNVGGAEVLGPAGLWYCTAAVDQRWLDKNFPTARKLVALWLRTSRYLNERPDLAVPELTRVMNTRSGSTYTPEQIENQMRQFVHYTDPAAARNDVYNPQSPLYWRNSLDFYAEQSVAAGELPAGSSLDEYNLQEQIYDSVMRDPALVEWIEAPLT